MVNQDGLMSHVKDLQVCVVSFCTSITDIFKKLLPKQLKVKTMNFTFHNKTEYSFCFQWGFLPTLCCVYKYITLIYKVNKRLIYKVNNIYKYIFS